MIDPRGILAIGTLLAGAGVWLLLPRGGDGWRIRGAVAAVVGLSLAAAQLPGLGGWLADSVFFPLAAITVVSAIGAVTSSNPGYCAIWFGLALVGVAGLFLLVGAQFLAVATIVVYAGAILVTFLFVLMLAQPQGRAAYDRVSWEPLLAAATGVVLVCVMSMTVADVCRWQADQLQARVAQLETLPAVASRSAPPEAAQPAGDGSARESSGDAESDALAAAAAGGPPFLVKLPSPAELDARLLNPQHMTYFGAELFGRELLAVVFAGVLLFAALVGAAVIIHHASGSPGGGTERRRTSET